MKFNDMKMLSQLKASLDGDRRFNDHDDSTVLTVESIENHIYFYSDVTPDRCLALIRAIREIDVWLRNERLSRSIPEDYPMQPIWLHINSGGGDLFSGLAISDQIKQFKTPVYSVIEGYAASAATLISMACHKRYILPNSFMMIHQLSSMTWGTYEELKDEVFLQEMVMNRMLDFYANNSNMERAEIENMLKRNSWMDSKQALERKFVDEVINAV